MDRESECNVMRYKNFIIMVQTYLNVESTDQVADGVTEIERSTGI